MPLIDPGHKAPSFTLPDHTGTPRSLKEFSGRSVVLYFYPKDDTTSCTAEACDFRDHLPGFDATNAAILAISPDPVKSHAKFVSKYALTFPLLADLPGPDGLPPVCEAFGVWQEKSMYGRKYMGVVRTTYLIGPDGKVLRRWDKVSVPEHASEVLAALGGPVQKPAPSIKPKAPKKAIKKTSK